MSATRNPQHPLVLVVEDEIWLLLDIAGALEDRGYDVLCARTGDEALKLLAEQQDIGVVFTDLDVPGRFDGFELAREIRQRRPDVRLMVASSRYRKTADATQYDVFVAKPCETEIVVSRVSHLAASRGGVPATDARRQ